MKEINEINNWETVEIPTREYRNLQLRSGRVQACADWLDAQDSSYVQVNDVLRLLGYSELACDREIAFKQKEAEAKGIEAPKL